MIQRLQVCITAVSIYVPRFEILKSKVRYCV